MRLVLPGFATMSEFVAGLKGDCGPTATLAALHEVNPQRWPLTPAGLKALDQDEISHNCAEQNGAQNIPHMDAYLSRLDLAHYTVGYDIFTFDRLHADLKALAGRHPIIVEWSLAGALPGDEAGVTSTTPVAAESIRDCTETASAAGICGAMGITEQMMAVVRRGRRLCTPSSRSPRPSRSRMSS